MLLHWIANLADQNLKQQQLKINMRVTYHTVISVWNKPLIDTCQHCSTSRANQALRSLANAGFQNRGVCLQAFPSFPSPSPHFHFFGFCFISRAAKTKNTVPPSLFAPKPNGNTCYTGYSNIHLLFSFVPIYYLWYIVISKRLYIFIIMHLIGKTLSLEKYKLRRMGPNGFKSRT